ASLRPKLIVTYQNPIPNAPDQLEALSTSASSVNLYWLDNSDNETGFQIEREKSGENINYLIGTPAANVTTFTDTGLESGTVYYYRIRAINAAGNSPYASQVSTQTFPATPNGLSALATSTSSVALNWTNT